MWSMASCGNVMESGDMELCEGVARGDAQCFDVLYDRYAGALFRFCSIKVGQKDAVDMVQEVFITLWKDAKSFRGESTFRSWLYGIAHHKCTDLHRRRGKEPVPLEEIENREETPGNAAEYLEVRRVLSDMSTELKEAIFLVYYKGLTYDEAASVLDIPVGTVRSRIHNSKNILLSRLTDREFGGKPAGGRLTQCRKTAASSSIRYRTT